MTRIIAHIVLLFTSSTFMSSTPYAQTFSSFVSKITNQLLPYESPNEFPSLSGFESENDFLNFGFQYISSEEVLRFIDPEFDEQLEDYVSYKKLTLNNKIGVIFYHEFYDTDSDIPFSEYILVVYSQEGKQLSRFDLFAYEWIQNIEVTGEVSSGESPEEQELFREMTEDYLEMETESFSDIEATDTTGNEVATEELEPNTVDEGYAISRIHMESGKVFLVRKNVSYFNTESADGILFILNDISGKFEEIIE